MNTKIQENARIQDLGWPAGIVGGLLFFSLGLELLGHQVFGQTDVDTLLWALSLGFWSFVLGTTGFLILTVQWWVEWRRFDRDKTMNVPGDFFQLASNSGAVNQYRKMAEPCAQAHKPDMAYSRAPLWLSRMAGRGGCQRGLKCCRERSRFFCYSPP
jgi:hypothetical protein